MESVKGKTSLTKKNCHFTLNDPPTTHLPDPGRLQSHIIVVHRFPPLGEPLVTTAIGAPGSYVGPTLHRVDPPDIAGWACPSLGPGLSPNGNIG